MKYCSALLCPLLSYDEVSEVYFSNMTFNTNKVTLVKSHFPRCLTVIVVFHQQNAWMWLRPLSDPYRTIIQKILYTYM